MKQKLLNLGCGKHYHSDWINVDFRSSGDKVIASDLNNGLPFKDNSLDAVYHSHLLEHLPKRYAPVFLSDCYRVLNSKGIIRVAVPDLEKMIRQYLELLEKSLDGDEESRERYEWIVIEMFDQMVRNVPGGEMLRYWEQYPMPAETFVIDRLGSEVVHSLKNIRKQKRFGESVLKETVSPTDQQICDFRGTGEIHQWMYDRYSLEKLLHEAGFEEVRVCRGDESDIREFNSYLLDIEPDGSLRKPDSLYMEGKKKKKVTMDSVNSLDNLLNQSIDPSDLTGETCEVILDQQEEECLKEGDFQQICKNNETVKGLKVVHLATLDHGGAGNSAYRLHKGLHLISVESNMFVLTKKRNDPSVNVVPSYYPDISMQNRALSKYPGRPKGSELFSIASSNIRLDLINDIHGADIIDLHWVAFFLDYPGINQTLRGKKIIWTLHDMNPFTGGCHYAGECTKYMDKCGACPQLGSEETNDLSRHIWKTKFNAYKDLEIHVVAPSKWLGKCAGRSALFSRFPVSVIPYGFNLDVFRQYSKNEVRKSLGIPESSRVILFGADSIKNERKGFKYLLHALNKYSIADQGKDIILGLFGHWTEEIKSLSKYPTINFGHIEDEDQLAMIYSASDVFVISSLEDNLPNTVIEAMACGLPVVGFNVGGIPDMIEHKKTGYLVKPGDPAGLIAGINWVISSAQCSASLSDQCRAKVKKKYSLKKQARTYKELYERILKMKRGISSNAQILNREGEALFAKGDSDGALKAFVMAAEIDPGLAAVHNNLGVMYLESGDVEKSMRYFACALQLDAYDRSTVLNCGRLLTALGKHRDAETLCISFLQKHPQDEEISQLLMEVDRVGA